jgi:aspartyl-tRNA(Asn)/glutamyl-tRNA(Gln) amidotransferase subunit A
LREAGAEIVDVTLPELDDLSNHDAGTAIGRFEVFRWHQDLLEDGANEYDPRVRSRIEAGRTVTNEDYLEALAYRNMLKASVWSRVAELDAVVLPTVAVVPPVLAGLEHEAGEVYRAANRAVLRNTAIGNFLDACAISIPIPTGGAPVGLMLMGPPEGDVRLFESALAVESALRAGR